MEIQLEVRKNSTYSIDVLKESSELSLQQVFPLVGSWLASLFAPVVLMAVGAFVGLLIDKLIFHTREAGLASVIGVTIPGLLIAGLYAGWNYVTLKVARREKVQFSDMFRPIPQMFSAAMVLCLTTIATALPSFTVVLSLLSPVIFMKFQLAPYFVVDQNQGPIDAMKSSWRETNRIWIPLAILDLIFFGISFVTGFTVIVPFAVFIVQSVASAIVYTRWVQNDELEEIEMGED